MPIKQPPHSAGRRLVGLRSAIDPTQIPSAPDVALSDQLVWSAEPFMTCDTQRTIPLARSVYAAVDQGNSSPRFIRATTYAFPSSSDLASLCEVPLAFIIQPFAKQRPEEAPVPVVDLGPEGPPRCTQCRAYINPWCIWTMGGQRWVCNLCGTESQVPGAYFSPLDHSGRRTDLGNRPELAHGTVDIIVPNEYWAPLPPPRILPAHSQDLDGPHDLNATRNPQPLRTLFLIDVSASAIISNVTRDACTAILDTLYGDDTQQGEGSLVGIMTYDSSLHLYDLTPGLSQPRMIVLSDVDDVFAPTREGTFVDPVISREEIEATLTLITHQFAESANDRRATFAAFQCALAIMADSGGRVIAFSSDLPNWGPHSLTRRGEVDLLGTDREYLIFRPQDPTWTELGEELAENGIAVSLMSFPKQPTDLGTLGVLCSATGGDLRMYPRYVSERDLDVVKSQVAEIWRRETVYDARLRARVSSGLRVTSCRGSFTETLTGDILFGAMDADKAISVSVEHERSLDTRKDVYVQCAILHTSITGQRRVRVINLALGAASLAVNVFRYADVDATMTYLAKQAVHQASSQTLTAVKEAFTTRCASLLLAYRRQCAASTAPTQLILPEAYKLLPVYGLGLLKDVTLKGGSSISSDLRNCGAQALRTMGAGALIGHVYPTMLSIHDLSNDVGVPNAETGWIPLPLHMRPTYMSMEPHGVYLIDNGTLSVLWVGRSTSPELIRDLFGVNSFDELSSASPIHPGSLIASQVTNILGVLTSRRGGRKVPFRVARQDMDAAEIEFSNMLVEDQNNDNMSYTDYICHVHKLINAALTSNTPIGGGHFWQGWL